MQQHIMIKAMLGGLLGTLGQMLLVYVVASLPTQGGFRAVRRLEESPCTRRRWRERADVPQARGRESRVTTAWCPYRPPACVPL